MTLGKTFLLPQLAPVCWRSLALNASAAVVCSGKVCWHAREAFEYPAAAGVVVHPDDWRWGPRERFVWREHEGRGYLARRPLDRVVIAPAAEWAE